MTTCLVRLGCGLCLGVLVPSVSTWAQDGEATPPTPLVPESVEDSKPLPTPDEARPYDAEAPAAPRNEIVPLTSMSLKDRVGLPVEIRNSQAYPKLEAELLAQQQQDTELYAVEPPHNWTAIGNPFATIEAPLEPLTHRPLYFEEPEAERYGCVCSDCCQPFVSGARFILGIPLVSVQSLCTPPHHRVTSCWPDIVDPAFEYDW